MVTEAEFRTSVLPFTLRYEGQLSLVRKDPGNWTGGAVGKGVLRGTKFGIAAASHPTLDIQALTIEAASDIYWREYCLAPGFDRLSLPLCAVVFDAGVMSGPARAKTWLADTRREATLAAKIAAVCDARLAFCQSRKTWVTFGNGWGARIEACEKRGLLLAAAAPVPLPLHPVAPAEPTAPRRTASPAPVAPQPAHQPEGTALGQFLRVLIDALFSPIHQGAHA